MTLNQIKKIIIDFVDYFQNNNVPYALVGGLAVIAWGHIRTTLDADFIVDQHKINKEDFVKYLKSQGYEISIDDLTAGFMEKTNINIWSGIFRIDFKGIYNLFARKTIDEAITISLFDRDVKIDSPELLIISKLCYGSEQDFEDAASVYTRLKQIDKVDFDKIENLATKLDIKDRFELLKILVSGNITVSKIEKLIDSLNPFDFSKLNNV